MLTEKDFKLIEKQANKLYGDLELEIIQEIAERIANVGYANTVVYNNAMILQETGVMYQDIINMVANYNETSASQIQEIFETAGINSLKYDDTIYRLAGLNPKGLSVSMVQLISATARNTHNNLSKLTLTTANTSQTQFLSAMNKAYMEVSTGVKSYSQSIIDTVKDISKSGAYIEYPSGQRRSIESAVRMNILTSVNQASGRLQELRAEEMGWDLVEVSAHGGARPEHAQWQGKVYSLKGITKGYKTLEEGCDYGSVTGLCGVNCRHTFFPYYKGSTKTYTNKELKQLKNEKVEYNGKTISKYEATQIQRKIERQIRNDKKEIAGLEGILTSNNKDIDVNDIQVRLKQMQNKYNMHIIQLNDFISQTGLKKDNSRLVIAKINKNNSEKIIKLNIDKVDLDGFDRNTKTEIVNRLNKLTADYNTKLKSVDKVSAIQKKTLEAGHVSNYGAEMHLSGAVKKQMSTVEHEFAHTLAEYKTDKLLNVNEDFWKEVQKIKNQYAKELKNIELKRLKDEITVEEAKKLKEKILIAGNNAEMNSYAMTNLDEFMAVSFECEKNGLTNSQYAKKIVEIIDNYFKK